MRMLLAGAHAGLIVFIEQGHYLLFLPRRLTSIQEGAVPFVVPTFTAAGRAEKQPWLFYILLDFEKFQLLY